MDIKKEKIGDATYEEGGKSCISKSVNRFSPHIMASDISIIPLK